MILKTDSAYKYLDEFSKALAAEVRMLLGEVGKLREERRNLQQYVYEFPLISPCSHGYQRNGIPTLHEVQIRTRWRIPTRLASFEHSTAARTTSSTARNPRSAPGPPSTSGQTRLAPNRQTQG